jgi:uncharacterized protein YsxB (DUF464 family)
VIKGSFKRNEAGLIDQFLLTGHAGAGAHGHDIVCAAVSALAINTVNSIDSLAGVKPIIEVNEAEGGFLEVALPRDITNEQRNIAQILMESLLLGLQAIQTENLEFVQVKTTTK